MHYGALHNDWNGVKLMMLWCGCFRIQFDSLWCSLCCYVFFFCLFYRQWRERNTKTDKERFLALLYNFYRFQLLFPTFNFNLVSLFVPLFEWILFTFYKRFKSSLKNAERWPTVEEVERKNWCQLFVVKMKKGIP